jgi:hypothetical protein
VPLSEHEQRVLEQMEQAMYAEDPKFASAMRGRHGKARQRQRLLVGGFGVVIGLLLVVLGVARGVVLLAVAGFVLMIATGAFALTPPRRAGATGPVGAVGADGRTKARRPAKQRGGSFMGRMEQRWERRRDEGRGWGG